MLPENWSSSYERITDNFGIVFAFRKGTSHEETFQWTTDCGKIKASSDKWEIQDK